MKPAQTGLTRIANATGYSLKGLRVAWQREAGFRQELAIGAVLLPLSFWLATSTLQWLTLVAPLFLVLITELLNSAIEAAIDRIGGERHELSGYAKDMGSAAVFLALILTFTCWAAIAWERFYGFD